MLTEENVSAIKYALYLSTTFIPNAFRCDKYLMRYVRNTFEVSAETRLPLHEEFM